ncbi:MAG: ATP synthase F1 subunit gamma [Eubacteriales bacterium]|nr:ATP synthase F1 subunit gamma [Eubacteriales bacterium]
MPNKLQQIKRHIRSVESTEKVTSAMKLVSAAKLRREMRRFHFTKENLFEVTKTLGAIAVSNQVVPNRWFERGKGKDLVVVLGSSQGFCGSFNVSLNNEIRFYEKAHPGSAYYPCGSRVEDYLDAMRYSMPFGIGKNPGDMDYSDIEEIADLLIQAFSDGKYGKVCLLTTCYVNSIMNRPVLDQLLPLDRKVLLSRFGEKEVPEPEAEGAEEQETFGAYVLKQYISTFLYCMLKESLVCEYSARRTAMNDASENAMAMMDKLHLEYNRERQEAITNELIEIVSGANAQQAVKN